MVLRWSCMVVAALVLAGCAQDTPEPSGSMPATTTQSAAQAEVPATATHAVSWNATLPAHRHACTPALCADTPPGTAVREHKVTQDLVRQWDVDLVLAWGEDGASQQPVAVEVLVPAGEFASYGEVIRANGTSPLRVAGTIELDQADADTLHIRVRRDVARDEPVVDVPEEPLSVTGTAVAHLRFA